MTVRELIEMLQGCNPDFLVVMSKDGEGNGFSPLAQADTDNSAYVPDSTWSGEVHLHHLTPELERQGYTDEDVADNPEAVRAVVLWPVN